MDGWGRGGSRMRVVVGVLCFCLVGLCGAADARRQHGEAWYQGRWCATQGGETEVVLGDGTRVDCVTATHAVEFDFGNGWAEAIGQSLHYARRTGRRAGVVLILEDPGDRRYWERLAENIEFFDLPIDAWQMGDGRRDGGAGQARLPSPAREDDPG